MLKAREVGALGNGLVDLVLTREAHSDYCRAWIQAGHRNMLQTGDVCKDPSEPPPRKSQDK